MDLITTSLSAHFEFTKDGGQARQRALTDEISKHNLAVETYNRDHVELRQSIEVGWDASHEGRASKLRGRLSALLTHELEIRKSIADHWEQVGEVDLPAYLDAAIADHAAAKREMIAKLESLGFRDTPNLSLETIASHHEGVSQPWVRKESVHGTSPQLAFLDLNAKAIEKAQNKMDEIKARAMTNLSI